MLGWLNRLWEANVWITGKADEANTYGCGCLTKPLKWRLLVICDQSTTAPLTTCIIMSGGWLVVNPTSKKIEPEVSIIKLISKKL